MSRFSAVAVLPSPTEPCPRLEEPSPFLAGPSNVVAVDLLVTATSLAAAAAAGAGQSFKSTEALIAQKQHQLKYIQQQQRIQQEKQRQLIYSQQQRHQQFLRCSGQLSFTTSVAHNGNSKVTGAGSIGNGKEPRVVGLVDDVWRLVFYILACDCKDLGRAMQVSRRFHDLIANDALLWRLTYRLTVSGSIFAGQKPLLSPSWIREQQQAGQELSGFSSLSAPRQGQSGSTSNRALIYTLDRNEDGLDSMPCNMDEHGMRRGPIGHREAESSSAQCSLGSAPASTLSALASSRLHPGSQSAGALRSNKGHANAVRTSAVPVTMAPGLQMPSPLILPHHRRMAQSVTALSSLPNQPTPPVHIANASSSQISYLSGTSSSNSSTINLEPTTTTATRTPASTPATMSMSSFPSTLSSSISQVNSSSSSTTSIRVIQHHIPSTTLMHHSPAVYWKHQVVEWLEQEKLRCLRLGLFWGFNAAASRAHGRKTNRTR
ncbi:MAG: hypothetical protein J3R72DRAFT_433691 [Linnemannia gamsii]|nr:MAG: hypothetical protein J3R72DRAFT_433691 [Linnemannia gamsii]